MKVEGIKPVSPLIIYIQHPNTSLNGNEFLLLWTSLVLLSLSVKKKKKKTYRKHKQKQKHTNKNKDIFRGESWIFLVSKEIGDSSELTGVGCECTA